MKLPLVVLVGFKYSEQLRNALQTEIGREYEVCVALDENSLSEMLPERPRLAILMFPLEFVRPRDLFVQRELATLLQGLKATHNLRIIGTSTSRYLWNSNDLCLLVDVHTENQEIDSIVVALKSVVANDE